MNNKVVDLTLECLREIVVVYFSNEIKHLAAVKQLHLI